MLSSSAVESGVDTDRKPRRNSSPLDSWSLAAPDAAPTVRRETEYLRAKARCDKPSIRETRLIAARFSTLVTRAISAPS